ncbi:3',5'-cyclic adenosine monophosphate phosphodiesterase CpdA [Thalassocella blandensis]|nr:3',5'-cyclic adenosine monophosphate phosphodiesterase CpdA [Thalassocella blandensis]
MRPFHLLQITDCHLGSKPGDTLLGMNTDESLCDVLQCMQEQEHPDMILVTGDISNDGGVRSYERFIEYIDEYFPNIPLAWLPGNHDDPDNMDQVENLPIEAHHLVAGWNMIFLDSKIPMEEGGDLQPSELKRLESELQKYFDMPTLVFLHHQVVPVGSAWVDQYIVKSHKAFFDVIDRYNNVKVVSWGHVHQEFRKKHRDVALIATPSTCVQFSPGIDRFQVDKLMPGYRSYKLYPDGRYTTQVHRVPPKDYKIDFDSDGY